MRIQQKTHAHTQIHTLPSKVGCSKTALARLRVAARKAREDETNFMVVVVVVVECGRQRPCAAVGGCVLCVCGVW